MQRTNYMDTDNIMFRDGNPDVGISSLDVVRISVVNKTMSQPSDSLPQRSQKVNWHIFGLPQTGEDSLKICAELVIRNGEWLAGITVSATLISNKTELVSAKDIDAINAATKQYGPWVSILLYNFAATALRSTLGFTPDSGIELPAVSPEPHIMRLKKRADSDT